MKKTKEQLEDELKLYQRFEDQLITFRKFLEENVGDHQEDFENNWRKKLEIFFIQNNIKNSLSSEYCDNYEYMDIDINIDGMMEVIKEEKPEATLTLTIIHDKNDEKKLGNGKYTFKNFYVYSNDFDSVYNFITAKICTLLNEILEIEIELNLD